MTVELVDLLNRLCPVPALAGREEHLRKVVAELAKPHAHLVDVDRAGNLRAWLNPEQRPLLMLDAHMDEVGLVVRKIDSSGLAHMAPVGGLDQRLLPGAKALCQTREGSLLTGLVGLAPPHVEKPGEADKAVSWENVWLDFGFADEAQALAAGLEPGLSVVLDAGNGPLGSDGYYARNLDDRAGMALLLALLAELKRSLPAWGICFNFSTGEEVGLRGAATAAYDLAPDLALAVEVTVGDTPGLAAYRQPSIMGAGPAITVMDNRLVVPWAMVDSLENAARQAQVKSQRKLPAFGGTNAGAIALSRAGVLTGVLSVPARYIHSPVSWLNLNDLTATYKLLLAWVRDLDQLLSGLN